MGLNFTERHLWEGVNVSSLMHSFGLYCITETSMLRLAVTELNSSSLVS